MRIKKVLRRDEIMKFITRLYDGDLHAKRVLSLAMMRRWGCSPVQTLAVHAIGQGLAQAMGKLSKHGVKQVDRLLSNEGIEVPRSSSATGCPTWWERERRWWWRWIGRALRETDTRR